MNDEIGDTLTRFFDRQTGHRKNVSQTQSAVDERKHPLCAHVEARSANVGVGNPRGDTPIVKA